MKLLRIGTLKSQSHKLLSLIFLSVVYVIVYDYVYREFVNVYFSYSLNSTYHPLSGIRFIFYVLISSFPLIFYRGAKTIAACFSFFSFIFAYVPILNSLFVYFVQDEIVIKYSLTLLICMILFFLSDRIYIFKSLFKDRMKILSIKILEILSFLCLFILILLNLSQLTFSNFLESQTELYEARADNDLYGIYLICWLRGCFFPLIMVLSLKKKNYIIYLLSFLAFFILFGLDKQKMTAVFPFVLTALYYVANKYYKRFSSSFHYILAIPIIVLSLALVSYISLYNISFEDNPALFSIAALFVMRTQCIEGMEAERYINFFETHEYTYYSHINIVNFLTDSYPYAESLGKTVSGGDGNSNATFWLMDGVAAGGISGVFIISIIFILFKSMMNSADIRCNVPLYVCISLQGIMSMMNVSLFTSINSSGLLVLFFILIFLKSDVFISKTDTGYIK